ncbi:DUF4179 domain-containing protein [Faecalimicrobium sp. JNUCC 81]
MDNKYKVFNNMSIDDSDYKEYRLSDDDKKNIFDSVSKEIKKEKITKKPLKIAMIVASVSVATFTTAYGLDIIIDYFNFNKESMYIHEEKNIITYGKQVNSSSSDKGIELIIDNVAADDSFINITYTIKSDKKLTDIDKSYSDPFVAKPFLSLFMGKEEIIPDGNIETEATIVSDNELKGILRYSSSKYNIKDNTKLELRTDEIFNTQGNWSIKFSIDKKSSQDKTHKYIINKNKRIVKTYDYNNKDIDVKFDLNIENVVLAPLGDQITITEKVDPMYDNFYPSICNSFALFDENNKSLDVIDKGFSQSAYPNSTTHPFEFIKADRDIKSMTLVPFEFDESIENKMLKSKSIENLPITFETSKYGKVIIEDMKIKEDEISYTYYKDGVVPWTVDLSFIDESGENLLMEGLREVSVDRENGRYTVYYKFSSKEDKDKVSKIKSVSMYSHDNLKLLYDQQIKFDLNK